ncbi:MAG: glycosyltransferase family 2 protein [Cellulosilyticaceae bacterium]
MENNNIEITIVIPNYNGEHYLKDCLDSIRNNSYKQCDVIIVDNCSEDSEYQWIKNDKDITFVELDKNYGFSRGVNEGIKRAKGEYVLLLNNDTIVQDGFFEELLKTIKSNDKIFGVSSKMINASNTKLIDDAGDQYTMLGWAKKRGDGQPVEFYTVEEPVFSACAGAALYRKSAFDRIGYFDEAFFAYMEDVDISYRAKIYGYVNVYCPAARVHHIGSGTTGSRHNPFKIRLAARNNVYVIYKNMPTVQLILNLPFIVIGSIIKYMFFCAKGHGGIYINGLLEGLKNLKNIKKIPFQKNHIGRYVEIQIELIKNTLGLLNK